MVLLLVFRPHLVYDFRVVKALRADPDAAAGGARQLVAADAGAVRVKVAIHWLDFAMISRAFKRFYGCIIGCHAGAMEVCSD